MIENIVHFFNFQYENFFSDIENAYKKCHWKPKIFTQTAVSDKDGESEFFSDHDFNNKEWGGTIIGTYNFRKKN